MFTTKRMIASGLLAILALIALEQQASAQKARVAQNELVGIFKSAAQHTITITIGKGREEAAEEKTFTLAKDVEVAVGNGGFRGAGLFREGKLADLSAGLMVQLSLSADKTVDSIVVEEPAVRGILKAADAKKLTITISGKQREQAGEEQSYALAANAEILVDDGRGRRNSIKEGKIEDLAPDAFVTVRLSLDKKRVHSVLAEGALVTGTIKSLDAAKKIVTLVTRPARGDDAAEERTLPVPAEAIILVDDGRGRRLSLKEAKLADVPIGAAAIVKLSADQAFAMLLKVEGPMVGGLLKAVDADKNTVTIAFLKNRGDNPEEKTYTLAKDARVMLDGNAAKLSSLKIEENGPMIQLRLSLDQTTVQGVMAYTPRPR